MADGDEVIHKHVYIGGGLWTGWQAWVPMRREWDGWRRGKFSWGNGLRRPMGRGELWRDRSEGRLVCRPG